MISRHAVHHVAGSTALPLRAIHGERDAQILDVACLVRCRQPGTERRVAVQRLAQSAILFPAQREIDADAIAGHRLERIGDRDAIGPASDHHGEFDLVVRATAGKSQLHAGRRTADRGCGLEEQVGRRGCRATSRWRLVLAVIRSHCDDPCRACHRGQQRHGLEPQDGSRGARGLDPGAQVRERGHERVTRRGRPATFRQFGEHSRYVENAVAPHDTEPFVVEPAELQVDVLSSPTPSVVSSRRAPASIWSIITPKPSSAPK